MSEHDILRARLAPMQQDGEVPAWSTIQARAAQLRKARTRRRRVAVALALAGAAILALPTPGLGGRLVDVLADRDARPALQEYLARFQATPDFGTVDVTKARELIDADTARGKVTLFEAPETRGSQCIGLYADWLSDPGISCGYTGVPARDLDETMDGRLDPHVLAIAGVAPISATSVELDVDGARSTSPVSDGFFFLAIDPTILKPTPTATLTALAKNGQQIASQPLDVAGMLAPICTSHTPGRLVSTVDVEGSPVEIHEAETATRRCWWLQSGGATVGGFSSPLMTPPYDPSTGPAAVLNDEHLPSGAQVLWGRAMVPAVNAVVHLVDGTDERIAMTDRYLVIPISPPTAPGQRPSRIDLLGADGSQLSSQPVDPNQPGRLINPTP